MAAWESDATTSITTRDRDKTSLSDGVSIGGNEFVCQGGSVPTFGGSGRAG